MNKKPHPDDFGFSLVQTSDSQRAMVAKMRTKLAGGSDFDVQVVTRRRFAIRKNAFGWASKLGIAAILILANFAYLSYSNGSVAKKAIKRAQMLPAPKATLSVNEQALYWTYALYDFNRLKTQFGASQSAVVDAKSASARLADLLPKVDGPTRMTIQHYLPPKLRTP